MTNEAAHPSQPGADHERFRDVDGETIGAAEFKDAFGEPIAATLDLDSWSADADLQGVYERLATEVKAAVEQEQRVRSFVRSEVFPLLGSRSQAPDAAGVYKAELAQVERMHRRILFAGRLETCDGTVASHDTLILTVTQIGVCLVSYQGDQLTLSQRLYRRDLRAGAREDPVTEAKTLLERRQRRGAPGVEDRRESLSELARRGIMGYAERAVLLERSDAMWRMGHGVPAPYELLTGSGSMELLESSLTVVRELVTGHRRFVFVPSSISDRLLLTIGDALRPLEYAIVDDATDRMRRVVASGHYERGKSTNGQDWGQYAEDFADQVGPHILLGVYRASATAPPRPFFAHPEHVHEAALIAMADSVLQEHRGFPLSIDIADSVCRTSFGLDTFTEAIRMAYTDAEEPLRHLNERETRK